MEHEIKLVRTRSDRANFVDLPAYLFRQYSQYVPPLRYEQRALLTCSHPFYGQGEDAKAAFFIAQNDDRQAIGRIAAIANYAYQRTVALLDSADVATGFFGFFDTIHDESVARDLLNAAATWLRQHGFRHMVGPASPSQNGEFGVLVSGIEQPHRFLLPFNPPYYVELLECCGLTKARDLFSFTVDVVAGKGAQLMAHQQQEFMTIWQRRFPNIEVRPINMRHFNSELAIITKLMERALRDHWMRTPMNAGEIRQLGLLLRTAVEPNFVLLAEQHGEVLGGIVAIPDINEALRHVRMRWGFVEPLELWLRLRTLSIGCVRVVLLGVARDGPTLGVACALLAKFYENLQHYGITKVDAHWVDGENNPMMNFLTRRLVAPDRHYRIYEKAL